MNQITQSLKVYRLSLLTNYTLKMKMIVSLDKILIYILNSMHWKY